MTHEDGIWVQTKARGGRHGGVEPDHIVRAGLVASAAEVLYED